MSALLLQQISGVDPADELAFAEFVEVFHASARHEFGDDHDERSVAEWRAITHSENYARLLVLARTPQGAAVGGLSLVMPLRDNETHALLRVAVIPEARRQGIGSALADAGEAHARLSGRRTVQSQTARRLAASAEADRPSAGEMFARGRGYHPAQTVIRSDGPLAATAAERGTPYPVGYDLQTHVGDLPDEWLEPYAHLMRAMSTDAPSGDLAIGEERWDVNRARGEREQWRAMGREVAISMVFREGVPAGFTVMQWAPALGERVYQHDTLVTAQHRGHGLGALLRQRNARAAARAWPGVRTIRTWNAAENAPMLRVNADLGYVPTAIDTEWQRTL